MELVIPRAWLSMKQPHGVDTFFDSCVSQSIRSAAAVEVLLTVLV